MAKCVLVDGIYEIEKGYQGVIPDTKYSAMNVMEPSDVILMGDNLQKLKGRIKEKRWAGAWIIACYKGQAWNGKDLIQDFHYHPKYR